MRGLPFALVAVMLLLASCSNGQDGPQTDCTGAGQENPDSTEPARLFSFAIIADTHIGEGFADFGTAGYEDEGADANDRTVNVEAAVAKVNAASVDYDLRFVMVLGDLTDSGERSEFVEARRILDGLALPYFPCIGNHDMWPYYWDSAESFVEAPAPSGDLVFEEVFQDHMENLRALFPDLSWAPAACDNPDSGGENRFVNYAFTYMGYDFVTIDLVTRVPAAEDLPGIGAEAALHDFDCGSWAWFDKHLAGNECKADHNVLVFLHHPPMKVGRFGLTDEDFASMDAFIAGGGYGGNLFGFFAGHLHFEVTDILFDGQHVVVTAAAKDDASVRIVQVFRDGRIDYDTLL